MNQTVIKIDSQILDAFSRCERLFEYSFVQHLSPIASEFKMQRGSLVHDIIMEYYTKYKEVRNKTSSMNYALEFGRAKINHYDSIDIPHGIEILDNMREYFNYYSNEKWIPIETEKISKKIIYEDDELVLIYVCKIDLVVHDGEGEFPVDHKTHDRYFEPLSLENQFTGYATVRGSSKLVVNKIGFQKSYKPEDKFRRITLQYNDARKEEWTHNTVRIAKDMIHCITTNTFPMRRTQCGMYGGCKMKMVCEIDPRDRGAIIEKFYKLQVWNPDDQSKEVE